MVSTAWSGTPAGFMFSFATREREKERGGERQGGIEREEIKQDREQKANRQGEEREEG